jgi:triacylglycerol esterase/lipase EstA (alpha/beta hydrolase family)
VLLGALTVAVLLTAGVVTWVLGGRATDAQPSVPPTAGSDDEPVGPVILVHGLGGGPDALRAMADRLESLGRETTLVTLPDGGAGDLRRSAAVLDEAVTETLDRTGAATVDVVGYSTGGVVARLWAAEGGVDVTRRIITLGSPHHGTTVADDTVGDSEACPKACRQMTTNSPVLAGLNDGDETPGDVSWVSIWSEHDQVVRPPDSARLNGAWNVVVQSVCLGARVEHEALPYVPFVESMVIEFLGPGSLTELGTDDCARLGG